MGLASERLSKADWIKAALRALAGSGVEAVRVERLAETLGVTKGSFYWHFVNRDALLAAILEAWRSEATEAIAADVEASAGDPVEKLKRLFAIVARFDGRLDLAVRRWAAQDEKARAALAGVDRRRLGYLEGLFAGLGFGERQALARARLVYHALIGQFAMGMPVAREEREKEAIEIVLPMLTRRAKA